jgi:RNA polymerase sigma-70 factor (ECF subfamily)
MRGERERDRELDPELEAFLAHGAIERRAPPEVRARALARAQAIVAAGGAIPTGPTAPARAPLPSATRGQARFRIAAAAALAIASAAVGAVAALRARSDQAPPAGPAWSPSPAASAPVTNVGSRTPASPARAAGPSTAPPSRPARGAPREDPFTAELELLQRAHGAYTRHEFSAALTLIAEHARRFPKGHLAEQREALRVRSLIGAGHQDEAQRAAAAFAVQFPRSVLLSRVGSESESARP